MWIKKKEKESVSKENNSLRVPPQTGDISVPSLYVQIVANPSQSVKSKIQLLYSQTVSMKYITIKI